MQICKISIMWVVLVQLQQHNFCRFILNKTPWAHLDIAGMAFSKYGGALNSSGATGYECEIIK